MKKFLATLLIRERDATPGVVTIAAGGFVRWINADAAKHRISTSPVRGGLPRPDGQVFSPCLSHGDEYTASFTVPGEYAYHSTTRPYVHGRILVQAERTWP